MYPIIRQWNLWILKIIERSYGRDYYLFNRWLFTIAPEYVIVDKFAWHDRHGIMWRDRLIVKW